MTRPRLSLLQICNMCVGFLGIQIGFGLQNANTSRIFQTLGAEVDGLAILWIAAPVTGLLVQPIVGHFSDRTWGRLGRRRPYFLVGALLTTGALFFMPHSPLLWIAAGMLWIMDASINVTMEPFRAFVGDLLPEEQRITGFALQSFFMGVGAVFASALPWILSNWLGISNEAPEGVVPPSVRMAFYIGGAMLLATVLWTVLTTREYSPAEMRTFEAAEPTPRAPDEPTTVSLTAGLLWLAGGAGLAALVGAARLQKELYVLAGALALFGALQLAARLVRRRGGRLGLLEVVEDLDRMPGTMRQLALVQFFAWFGLFAMWIYTTPAVARVHFGAPDAASPGYNEGADWVGILFAVYNGVAALAALAIPFLARRLGRRGCHALNLTLGGLGLASFWLIRDPALLALSMVGVGFAWASILSVPYAILAGALPAAKMGVYMGVFNIFIVTPQLVAATILGLLLKTFFAGEPIYALVLGGGSMLVAAALTFAVENPACRSLAPAAAPAGAA